MGSKFCLAFEYVEKIPDGLQACSMPCLIDQLKFTNVNVLYILFCRQTRWENRIFLNF